MNHTAQTAPIAARLAQIVPAFVVASLRHALTSRIGKVLPSELLKRMRRIATHLSSPDPMPQSRVALLLPIFEPAVVRVLDGTFVIMGFEFESRDGRMPEYRKI